MKVRCVPWFSSHKQSSWEYPYAFSLKITYPYASKYIYLYAFILKKASELSDLHLFSKHSAVHVTDLPSLQCYASRLMIMY
jgi:hypothetical protein